MHRASMLATTAALSLGLVQAAAAGDLQLKARPLPPSLAFNWTGFYVGGNVGYSSSDRKSSSLTLTSPNETPVSDSFTLAPSGWLGGFQAGYNWQTNNLLFGIEGDWQRTNQKDSFCGFFNCEPANETNDGSTTINQKLSWIATLRGRIGYAQDRWLIYLTGGAAWGKVHTDISEVCPDGCGPNVSDESATFGSFSKTKSGWVVGTGIEVALTDNWSLKGEYLHVDLGTVTNSITGTGPFTTTLQSRVRDEIARVGINYRFGYARY
jgi:outer membrane immunogenic protein